jgi:hypothetical protein
MDYYEFFTENNEYKIVLKKRHRMFCTSEYSNYICTLEFKNSIDQTVVSIEGTELTFVKFVEGLNDFILNFGQEISDNLYFSESGTTGTSYFFYIAMNPIVDYPAEDDDKVYLTLFESSLFGNVMRLSLETTIFWVEEFIFALFQILEDIPYLTDLVESVALEYIDYSKLY